MRNRYAKRRYRFIYLLLTLDGSSYFSVQSYSCANNFCYDFTHVNSVYRHYLVDGVVYAHTMASFLSFYAHILNV